MTVHDEGIERIIEWLETMGNEEVRPAIRALRELQGLRSQNAKLKGDAERLFKYVAHGSDCPTWYSHDKCNCRIGDAMRAHEQLMKELE